MKMANIKLTATLLGKLSK